MTLTKAGRGERPHNSAPLNLSSIPVIAPHTKTEIAAFHHRVVYGADYSRLIFSFFLMLMLILSSASTAHLLGLQVRRPDSDFSVLRLSLSRWPFCLHKFTRMSREIRSFQLYVLTVP